MEKNSLDTRLEIAARSYFACINIVGIVLLLTICPALTIFALLTPDYALAAIVSIGWIVGLGLLVLRIKRTRGTNKGAGI